MDGDLHGGLIARRRFFDGHSDTLGFFADGGFLRDAGQALAAPFRRAGVEVAGIEARGFVLAAVAALELDA